MLVSACLSVCLRAGVRAHRSTLNRSSRHHVTDSWKIPGNGAGLKAPDRRLAGLGPAPAQPSSAQLGSVQLSSAQPSPAQLSSAQLSSAQPRADGHHVLGTRGSWLARRNADIIRCCSSRTLGGGTVTDTRRLELHLFPRQPAIREARSEQEPRKGAGQEPDRSSHGRRLGAALGGDAPLTCRAARRRGTERTRGSWGRRHLR